MIGAYARKKDHELPIDSRHAAFTVAGQLLVKAGMIEVGPFPARLDEAWSFMLHALLNDKVVLGLTSAVVAASVERQPYP